MHKKVNPSTSQHKWWSLLRVDPERRFFTPPLKVGLAFDPSSGRGCAAEWVNENYVDFFIPFGKFIHQMASFSRR
jgi:hypothetical protein